MEGLIGPAFARALETGRDRFNARFAQARRAFPRLDGTAFLELLRKRVNPIAGAIPEPRAAAVVDVLYDVSLELLGKGLLGPTARQPEYERLWSELLLNTAGLIATAPAELVGPLSNALSNLMNTSGCRAAEWCRLVAELAPSCPDAETLLKLGQIAAWRCGMAHYRTAALELARSLPAAAVAAVLLSAKTRTADVSAVLDRLAADPWFDPAAPAPPGVRVVAEVGGFRGFGGEFRQPPRVSSADGSIYATDGESTWLLTADAFGAVFHRTQPRASATGSGRWQLDRAGSVNGRGGKAAFPVLAGASSSATTETTLAVTLPHSHRVFLIGEA